MVDGLLGEDRDVMPVSNINDITEFVGNLSTDEVGDEIIGSYRVAFEGFTDECWADYEEGLTTGRYDGIDSLEEEMISDWSAKYGARPLMTDWTYGSDPWTDTTFYAVFLAR